MDRIFRLYTPRSCFWSMGRAEANIEAVSGSWPLICTAGSIEDIGTALHHNYTGNYFITSNVT